MADHALNGWKMPAQPALEGIHRVMHRADRQRRIDVAVKIDDFTGGGFSHAHVVNLAERRERRRQRGELLTNFGDPLRVGIAASQHIGRQRLDVSFDLDLGSKLMPDRIF